MQYQLTGTVKEIMEPITFASGFSKREFVVTSEEKYAQDIKLECVKDKMALIDNLAIGQRVTVDFDMRGNNKNSKGLYFCNNVAWKIESAENVGAAPVAATNGAEPDDLDVLPF